MNEHINFLATVPGTVLDIHNAEVMEIDVVLSLPEFLNDQGLERCSR